MSLTNGLIQFQADLAGISSIISHSDLSQEEKDLIQAQLTSWGNNLGWILYNYIKSASIVAPSGGGPCVIT